MSSASFGRRRRPGTQTGIISLLSIWTCGLMIGHRTGPICPRRPVQHAVGPRLARIRATGHRDLPVRSAGHPAEAHFLAVLGHVELLIRRRPCNCLVPLRVKSCGDGRCIIDPGT
jgi:hypothetical protein